MENVSAETLMFKVKTTNPDKFRVSPPAGIIRPKQLERITVTMVHGHRVEDTSARDKFLIMCKPLEDGADDFVPIDKIHKDFKQASENLLSKSYQFNLMPTFCFHHKAGLEWRH